MAKIQLGTDYLLWVNTGTTEIPAWKPVMCQTGMTINDPKEVIDGRSKCGNKKLVDEGEPTVEFDALLLQKDTTDLIRMTTYEWTQLADSLDNHEFKAAPKTATAADDGKIIYSWVGPITNSTTSFPDKETAKVSSSITVDGQIDKEQFVFEP